ncbi:nuclear transport factor 2 family protein [Micromonospora phytophila]|uniref:nuclear transport factor 2 family protein n=1 Tax=Micromonospora phytophila TaxID=709888 RepID=UPI0020305A50|nr:nuclear transport factor 2 family protein [Micromonospora phytophila]MCM0678098.1 nuclear transport factor 2 family protein [Micromonospora phytophila]
MRPLHGTDPKQFIADFVTSFTHELLRGDDDPGPIVDRYHTPDVVQIADGHRMDREALVAHTRPVRRNRPDLRMEVHEALADGDRIAARYTMHVRTLKKTLAVEVCLFGQFATDGRMRRAHLLTRTLPADVEDDAARSTPQPPDRQETRA